MKLCSYDQRWKWKKNYNEKNVVKAKMSHRIDDTIKQALATFRNAAEAFWMIIFLDSYLLDRLSFCVWQFFQFFYSGHSCDKCLAFPSTSWNTLHTGTFWQRNSFLSNVKKRRKLPQTYQHSFSQNESVLIWHVFTSKPQNSVFFGKIFIVFTFTAYAT